MLQPAQVLRNAPGTNAHSLRAALFFMACAILALFISFLSNPLLFAIVFALGVCCFSPALFDIQRGRFDAFETIHVMGLRYFLYFGMGAIWTFQDPGHVAYDRYIPPYLTEATFYCLIGFVALLAGYYGPWFRPRARIPRLHRPTGIAFVLIPGLLGLVGALAGAVWAEATWIKARLSMLFSSLSQLAPLFHFAWALCWMMVLSRRTTSRQNLLLLSLFVPSTIMVMLLTMLDKSMAVAYVAVPLVAWWYTRRKLPWRSLLVLVLILIFFVFPVFNTYRIVDARLSLDKRLELTSAIISQWDSESYLRASTRTVKGRLALINSVAVVVRDVGRWVPYARGETLFVPMMTYFVPRVLWPDKPWFNLGREFGVRFRVVSFLDDKTSISLTVPGELYWNFDLAGVIVGMALWGVLLRFFYRRYGGVASVDPVRGAIHIVVLIRFAHFGGGLAPELVLLLRTLIVLEAYCWLSRRMGLLRPVG